MGATAPIFISKEYMQIVLNPDLVQVTSDRRMALDHLANSIVRKFDKQPDGSTFKLLHSSNTEANTENFQLGYVGLLSTAYNRHEKIEVGPHDLWFLVLTEIVSIIKNNVNACRPLFTNSDEKVDISVPTDDVTTINLEAVIAQLKNAIPLDTSIFIPELSTLDDASRIALYAALADGVSPYYSYSTYMCGIPEVRVTGTREDWNMLLSCTAQIASAFFAVGLPKAVEYMIRVGDVLEKISASFETPDVDFWKDIFTSKNVGSGSELKINGWITQLFFVQHDLKKIENYMSNLAIVDYVNKDTGRKFRGVYGPFNQVRTEDGFIKASYGSVIYEQVEKSRIILAR